MKFQMPKAHIVKQALLAGHFVKTRHYLELFSSFLKSVCVCLYVCMCRHKNATALV